MNYDKKLKQNRISKQKERYREKIIKWLQN